MSKILVIDDDSMIIKLAGFMLKKMGHEVISAKNGLEGIEVLNAEKPDLVLLDVLMPGVDGFETFERIKAGAYVPPVCFITGTPDKEVIEKCRAKGALYCIKKPLVMDEVHYVLSLAKLK